MDILFPNAWLPSHFNARTSIACAERRPTREHISSSREAGLLILINMFGSLGIITWQETLLLSFIMILIMACRRAWHLLL
jgi:hypothetical protein